MTVEAFLVGLKVGKHIIDLIDDATKNQKITPELLAEVEARIDAKLDDYENS